MVQAPYCKHGLPERGLSCRKCKKFGAAQANDYAGDCRDCREVIKLKTSELIKKLQDIQTEYGDIEVMCWPFDGQDADYPLAAVEIVKRDEKIMVVVDA